MHHIVMMAPVSCKKCQYKKFFLVRISSVWSEWVFSPNTLKYEPKKLYAEAATKGVL